jgi:hypothetical protein
MTSRLLNRVNDIERDLKATTTILNEGVFIKKPELEELQKSMSNLLERIEKQDKDYQELKLNMMVLMKYLNEAIVDTGDDSVHEHAGSKTLKPLIPKSSFMITDLEQSDMIKITDIKQRIPDMIRIKPGARFRPL